MQPLEHDGSGNKWAGVQRILLQLGPPDLLVGAEPDLPILFPATNPPTSANARSCVAERSRTSRIAAIADC
jgi:hypothetical protein